MKASPASARQAVRRSSVSGAGSKTPQAESARRGEAQGIGLTLITYLTYLPSIYLYSFIHLLI